MLISLLLPAAHAISATVSPGDDLNAVVTSLGPGDVITFTAGTYELTNSLRVSEAVGEEGSPVRLVAADGAEVVLKQTENDNVLVVVDSSWVHIEGLILEGRDTWEEEGGGGLVVNNSSHISIVDNELRQLRGDVLRFGGDTSDMTVRHNHLHHSSRGTAIYIGCGDGSCWMSDSIIEDNLIHDIGTPDDNRSGIYLDNGCQGNTIAENVVFGVTGLGIHVESTQLGDPNTIEGNAVFEIGNHGIEITGEAIVRNNVVFQTEGVGIRSGNHENDDLRNVRITFNTVALTGQEGIRLDDWGEREGMVLSSNVVANITGRAFRWENDQDPELAYVTANVFSGLVEGIDAAEYPEWFTPGSGVADFADVENWDFYPGVNSSLVGAGDPSGEAYVPSVDFNGDARNGEAPTVGAYQWSGAGNPGWLIAEDFKGEGGGVTGPAESGGGCCKKSDDVSTAMIGLPLPLLLLLRRRRG